MNDVIKGGFNENNNKNTDTFKTIGMSYDLLTNNTEQDAIGLLEAIIADLQLRISELKKKNNIFSLWSRSFNDENFSTMITSEGEYNAWFRYLPQAASRFLVILV